MAWGEGSGGKGEGSGGKGGGKWGMSTPVHPLTELPRFLKSVSVRSDC